MENITVIFAITVMAASCVLLGWEMRELAEARRRENSNRRRHRNKSLQPPGRGSYMYIESNITAIGLQEELCETNDRYQAKARL